LLVGGIPKNSPSFVPLISPRPNPRSPSANRSAKTKTASENGVKSHGTRVTAKIASDPPTT